ncbi:right-handed parallel beta-helix repeat-containing protein, partial [archaeon]|nr:right-handed parallel beta-helix repeat-containing protein [archaeon]
VFDASDAGFVGFVNSDFCRIKGIQPERHIQGIVIAFSRFVSVYSVSVTHCLFGAYMIASTNSTIEYSGFVGMVSAVSVISCSNSIVERCNVTLCGVGVEAYWSFNLTIRTNTVTSCTTGVLLNGTNYSCVEANSIREFNQTGVHLINAFNDTVQGNLVTSILTSVGINVTVVSNETVETDSLIYNNWISATTHVVVVNATALWNVTAYTQGPNIAGGPYLGGNYWAGFAEVDNNPDDGYNDTAFVIDANNIDYLPLVLEGPLVEIVDPANGTVLAQHSVLVTWYGPGFTPPTDYFNVFLNGTQQNTLPIPAGTDPVYSYTITVPSDGCFEIRVDGFQGIPTPTSSDSVIIYVDTQPPSITITSPSNGSVVAGPQVDIWWTGSDTGTGITHYLVRVDNGDWVDVGLNQSCVVPALSDGWHSVDVAAVDAAGNAAIDTVVFFADSSPPTIHLLDPPEGGCVSTNASQYTLSWTASDNYNVSAVEVYVNASLKARLSGSTTSYTIDLPEEGIYNISVVAFDSVGFNASSSATIVVDRTSPIVQIVEPSKGCILGSKNLTVAWEVKELEVSSQYIELTYPNGTTHAWKLDATTRNFTIANLDEGSYNVSLHVYDAAGNKGSGTTYFSIDLTPPTLQILNPMNHTLLNTPQITVCINATDAHPCTIEVLLNGQLTKTVNWNSSGLQEIPLDVSEQNYTLTVRATDAANWSASATVVFAVDLTPPSISILQPSESAVLTSTIVTIEWHLSDAYGVAELQLLIDGIEAKRILAPPDSSSVEVLVPEGWHTLQAVAFDYVNHSSQAVRTFAVDTSPPSLQILEPANHSSVPEGNLTVQWRVTDAVGVQKISLYLNDTLIADFDSTATNYVLTLSSGTYIIRLTAIDLAGHETSVVVVVRVTVAPAPAPTPAPSPSALPLLLGIVAAAIVAAVVLLLWRRRKRTR